VHGEQLYRNAIDTMFDPFRVSVMIDCNGSNSTAAAAVLSAARHVKLEGSCALVLAATGPVGQRVAKILANEKCKVYLSSRSVAVLLMHVGGIRAISTATIPKPWFRQRCSDQYGKELSSGDLA
jgi:hypothetical protein